MAPPKRKNPLPDSLAAHPAASRTLSRLVATGAIKASDKPQTWYKHPQYCQAFAPIHPEKFRKGFRKLVTEKYGVPPKKGSSVVAKLRAKSTGAPSSPSFDDGNECDDIEDFVISDNADDVSMDDNLCQETNATNNPLSWKPIFILSSWKDPSTKDNRVSVAVSLPSGVSEKAGDLRVKIEGDNVLKVTVMWPFAMSSVLKLMQRWLSGEAGPEMREYHSQVQGFYNFLEDYQSSEDDPIHSTARIALPISAKPDFERILLGWENTNQIVLFVTTSAPDRHFKKEDDLFVVQVALSTPQPRAVPVQTIVCISDQ